MGMVVVFLVGVGKVCLSLSLFSFMCGSIGMYI